ncbi:MAG: DivIVA domain-containing protein [Propionibacteriaceae bacterium]|jgi:DivIVA domain-containing protein|nr:DivIVA domain-containing protein [Propionibacteriaceae bacterium]
MEWMLWILAVAVLGVGAVVASGRFGELPRTVTSTPVPRIPDGDLSGQDIREARFAVTFRGYSMQQVDELLDRVAWQLDQSADALAAPSFSPEGAGSGIIEPVQTEVCDGSDETANR